MNPEISIIVPVYNVEKYIHDCLNSILGQSFKNLELILVNDGSTDNSGVICDEYQKKDSRVVVVHKENGGQSSARNKGIDLARGNYIGFVDSDDWVEQDMYKILYTKAIENDADITACNLVQFHKDGTNHIYCNKKDDCLFDRDSAMHELYLNERLTFSPCNKLYKKKLFDGLRFKEGYILEDLDSSYKIMHRATVVYYTGKALYNYRYNDTSTMRKVFSKKRIDEFEVRKNMYLFYLENYPNLASELYAEWVLTGFLIFINIEKYYQKEKQQYRYLIDFDRKKIKPLLAKEDYDRKKKLLLRIGAISPILLVKFYRFYWDKIKKEL